MSDRARITREFSRLVPLNAALGLQIGEVRDSHAEMTLPWDERWIGDPERRVLHGGAITTLLDAVCGMAAFMAFAEPGPLATLDLRIDYFRPARPEEPVHATADVVRTTRKVAFVRAVAHQGDTDHLVASATATFIRTGS